MTAHHARHCPDCGEPYPSDGTSNPCAQPACAARRSRCAISAQTDAKRHALAKKRTLSRQYPDRTPVCVDGLRGPDESFDDLTDAMRAIVNDYRQEHRDTWPSESWVPSARIFGITTTKHSLTAEDLAEDIITHVQEEDAYEDWDVKESQRAELIRLLGPVIEAVGEWDLGYTQDLQHAIDIEPEDLAATIRQMKREEGEP